VLDDDGCGGSSHRGHGDKGHRAAQRMEAAMEMMIFFFLVSQL